jgi:hypothetical protein
VTVQRNGISLVGAGANSSRFISEQPDHSYILYGSPANQVINFSVQQLCFNSRVPRNDGAYLHFSNTFNAKIENCLFANSFIAVNVENSSFFYMSDCMIIDPSPQLGLGVLVHGNGRHNDQYFSRVFVQSQDRSGPCAAGFRLANSQALWMTQCGAYHCNTGMHILATAGMTCEHMFFSDNHADNCVGDGWVVEAGLSSTVRRLQFSGDWSASNAGSGWILRGSGGTIDDISMLGVRLYNNGRAGIFAENAGLVSVQNSTFGGNGLRDEAGAEIALSSNIKALILQGNRLGAISGYPTSTRRMISGFGAARDTVISGNVAVGFEDLCDDATHETKLLEQNTKFNEV